jgi:tetratricopeptide (TPR) repeat protein
MNPLCFVLIPFGKKTDASGTQIDFDVVYRDLIVPAVEAAGLSPIRADEEMFGGIIHKPMYERLILCEYAVADLTTGNPNVFYELGVRHAVRPWRTVLMFAEGGSRLPFDVSGLRALPYRLSGDGRLVDGDRVVSALKERLKAAREAVADSPIFQLGEDFPDIDRTKTDVFRDRVRYSQEMKKRLAAARKEGIDALLSVEAALSPIDRAESGVVIDLFLSYRAVKAWPEMIRLAEGMSPPLAASAMVREQLALALNRNGRSDEAEQVLLELIDRRGPSSETYGILGRVYKDRWESAARDGQDFEARAFLGKAIEAYLKGFEADWRDAYPGVNAVTLMALREPPDPRGAQLIPVVAYAVERRIAAGKPDYWDYATLLELAVLGEDESGADRALGNALTSIRETWEPESTVRNLRLIREAREKRGLKIPWAEDIETVLAKKAH